MKRALLTIAVIAAALAGWGATRWLGAPAAEARSIEVWKSQTCGCCTSWIAYVEDHGFAVKVHDVDDVDPVKDQFNIPLDLRSCHTARIGGYVIEGHVAVPGMPSGAPGMDEDDSPYPIIAFGGGQIRPLEH